MIAGGYLKKENLISPNQFNYAPKSPYRPQIFENVIKDRDILQRIFLASETQNHILSGKIIAAYIYLMNHTARVAHAELLGGKLANWDQLKRYWNGITGDIIDQKMIAAQIPALGWWNANFRDFYALGQHASYLRRHSLQMAIY